MQFVLLDLTGYVECILKDYLLYLTTASRIDKEYGKVTRNDSALLEP